MMYAQKSCEKDGEKMEEEGQERGLSEIDKLRRLGASEAQAPARARSGVQAAETATNGEVNRKAIGIGRCY